MLKPLISALLLSTVPLVPMTTVAQTSSDDQAVIKYEKDYFIKYDPVTLLDMLQRVPGVQAILDRNRRGGGGGGGGTQSGGQQERGFGSGGDQILINNKRLAGKANNINSTLQRISASTVERVEIIRGASGDLDVQSQGLVVNIIMDEGASTSSTFWKVGGRYSDGYAVSPDLQISHNGSSGNFDYILGIEAKQNQHIEHRNDVVYTPENVLTQTSERRMDRISKYIRFNGNLTYNAENGDELRLNAQFEPIRFSIDEPRFKEDVGEEREFQYWNEDATLYKGEVGGDYTKNIDGLGKWKTLFIASREDGEKVDLFENVFDSGNVPVFRNEGTRVKQEKILRSSLTTGLFGNQSIEIGGEAAINNYDQLFKNEDYVDDAYILSVNDDVSVTENRYEIFANHTYNISPKMVLQSSLVGEFSKISSLSIPFAGDNIERSKKFSFLKPRVDFRYDFSDRDQLRLTAEKKVSQLNFQNFVATYDVSNDVLRLGNTGIVPEKSWNYSLTYEHRLPNDAGTLQVELFYRDLTDYIELVNFTEFTDADGVDIAREELVPISKSGNIPTARSYGIKASGSLRLGFVGVPEAVISVDYVYDNTDVIDQFSGIHRPFKWKAPHEFKFNFRHDVTKWGMSYGAKGTIKGRSGRHEINEVASTYNGDNYQVFVEKKIWNDFKLILLFEHITPLKYTTDVKIYNDHIRYNDLAQLETGNWIFVKEYSIQLQGTF